MIDLKNKKTIIIAASVIAGIGITYFIYRRIKISQLNSEVNTPENMV